ncbi:uracil-DNA glycosylase [Duganella sp. Root1480D1]|uniref:uracil-DNA glycosylase n=1 Tax=Duganella sp. Root1480D1 TaxID=1736471 RepID=UPI0009E66F22|nr:uracil-DNA glycosylase [Duganella sp. Root1480D1]
MSDRRSAVFLEEMGVGPQWRLRHRAVSAEDADAAFVSAPGAEPAHIPLTPADEALPDAHPVQAPAQYAPAASQHQSTSQQPPAARQASAAPQRADGSQLPAAAAAARVATAPPAVAADVRQATHSPSGPDTQAAPAAPTRVPGTPSIASTGEDMSWFDDAPTPEYKPQRKKVAAPEQPAEAPPQRPAPVARPAPMQSRSASAPPAAKADEMPAYDDLPMDEPPSWFDDEQASAPRAEQATPRTPDTGRATDEQIAQMDWPALQAAIGACTRCGRCETRQQAVPGRGDEQATWIALDTAPGQAEDTEGYQFAGAPGYLLDNMLKAVGQGTEKGAYLTSLVKCYAPAAPSGEELQACRPYLQRELELTQAKVIVAFGHTTGKGLLGGAARGRIMLHDSVPVVATYHPADLLKKPEEKARAWQDLCLAKAAHAGRR